ncbi:hypothetical protein ACJX0J_003063 (mitochondrion) [Zea mays]
MTFAWNVSKYIIAELGFFGVLASLFPIEIQSSILLGGTAQGKEKEPDKIFTFTIPSNQARLIKSLLEQNEDLQRELIYRSMRDPFQGSIKNLDTKPDRTRDLLGNGKI